MADWFAWWFGFSGALKAFCMGMLVGIALMTFAALADAILTGGCHG